MSGASIIGGMLAIGLNFKGAAGQLRGIGGKVYGWWTGKDGVGGGSPPLSIPERLAIYFDRLKNAPTAGSADEAIQMIKP